MKLNYSATTYTCLALILSLSACSTHIPPAIKQPLDNAPEIGEVRDRPKAHLSQKVRWGGVILAAENKQDSSSLTVVAFPLGDDGEPEVSDQSSGRFIAHFEQFLEPMIFSSDREVTVIGKLLETQTVKVGEYAYEYPVVEVEHYYIWPVKEDPVYVDYPPYGWYDPWYPYPYPYYLPHSPRHHHH